MRTYISSFFAYHALLLVELFTHNVRLIFFVIDFPQSTGIHVNSLRHLESPLVGDLLVEVEVNLSNHETVPDPGETRRAASVRTGNVRRPVEVAEILVSWLPITRRKLVRESFLKFHEKMSVGLCFGCTQF